MTLSSSNAVNSPAASGTSIQQPPQNTSAMSNVDLLLDLGCDSFSSTSGNIGQGFQSQGQVAGLTQSHSGGFDTNFDLLTGTSDSTKPAGDSVDPWGDFASAR